MDFVWRRKNVKIENILDPVALIDKFGSDELRYYLMKEVIFGLDGNVNIENFKNTINDLANNSKSFQQNIYNSRQKL